MKRFLVVAEDVFLCILLMSFVSVFVCSAAFFFNAVVNPNG